MTNKTSFPDLHPGLNANRVVQQDDFEMRAVINTDHSLGLRNATASYVDLSKP
jgi:hypothetical protein